MTQQSLPSKGKTREAIFEELKTMKSQDADWHDGKMFGLIYEAGQDVEDLFQVWPMIFAIPLADCDGLLAATLGRLLEFFVRSAELDGGRIVVQFRQFELELLDHILRHL